MCLQQRARLSDCHGSGRAGDPEEAPGAQGVPGGQKEGGGIVKKRIDLERLMDDWIIPLGILAVVVWLVSLLS